MNKVSIHLLPLEGLDLSSFSLDEDELKELEIYKIYESKLEHAASKYLKKLYCGSISYNKYGKPFSDSIFFNVSHSRKIVGIALCKTEEVGFDIEAIRDVSDNLIDYVCNEAEIVNVSDNESFLRVFTSKEALVKAKGIGISRNIKSIPALPLEGYKEYEGEYFYSKSLKLENNIISVCLKGKNDFEIEIIKDKIV